MEKERISNLFAAIVFLFLAACNSNSLVKEYKEIREDSWHIDKTAEFTFRLDKGKYPVNYLIRNTPNYPFNNLYLKTVLLDSTGKELTNGLEEVLLFEQKTGKPLGDGMGDLFDQKISSKLLSNYSFPYGGTYRIQIQHKMRPDELPGILGIGFEINKTTAP